MSLDLAGAVLLVAIVFIPFIALAAAAFRFGFDSRPDIRDTDRPPWLVG